VVVFSEHERVATGGIHFLQATGRRQKKARSPCSCSIRGGRVAPLARQIDWARLFVKESQAPENSIPGSDEPSVSRVSLAPIQADLAWHQSLPHVTLSQKATFHSFFFSPYQFEQIHCTRNLLFTQFCLSRLILSQYPPLPHVTTWRTPSSSSVSSPVTASSAGSLPDISASTSPTS
jgi:hypothetical protein